jgi:hypothetical protein
MFDWLHLHHNSTELEHAKHRQLERDATSHQDPLEEYEYIKEDGLVVEEISPEEFQRQWQELIKKYR